MPRRAEVASEVCVEASGFRRYRLGALAFGAEWPATRHTRSADRWRRSRTARRTRWDLAWRPKLMQRASLGGGALAPIECAPPTRHLPVVRRGKQRRVPRLDAGGVCDDARSPRAQGIP